MKVMISMSALAPSMYRPYVKGWDKGRYADIFAKFSKDKKAYRVYLPVNEEAGEVIEAPALIQRALGEKGYLVEDYRAGIAVDKTGKRRMRIGKLIADNKELKQLFDNDSKRKAFRGKYIICVSRHPYDIVGASTARGWTSCMNLVDGEEADHLEQDVKHGTIIAYLIDQNDTNINRPVGRALIKPFINKGHTVLRCEKQVYGTTVDGFVKTIQHWLDKNFNHGMIDGRYKLAPKLYADGESSFYHVDTSGTDFWDRVNKSINSDDRNYAIENIPDVLTRLSVVTQDDINRFARVNAKEAFLFLKKHKASIASSVAKESPKSPKLVLKRAIDDKEFINLLHRMTRFNPTRWLHCENIFKISKKDRMVLLRKNTNLFSYMDHSKIDIRTFLVDLAKKDSDPYTIRECLDAIVDKTQRNSLVELLIPIIPALLFYERPLRPDLLLKYWKDVEADISDMVDFASMPVDDLRLFIPIAAKSRNHYTSNAIGTAICVHSENVDLVKMWHNALPASRRDWLDRTDDTSDLNIEKWDSDFVTKVMKDNPQVMIEAIKTSLAHKDMIGNIIKESPIEFLDGFGFMSSLADWVAKNEQDAYTLIDALVAANALKNPDIFWRWGFTPKVFYTLRTEHKWAPSRVLKLLDYFVAAFPEVVSDDRKVPWTHCKFFAENTVLFKHVAGKWPWLFSETVKYLRSYTKVVNRRLASLKPMGTASQKRKVNAVVLEAQKALKAAPPKPGTF